MRNGNYQIESECGEAIAFQSIAAVMGSRGFFFADRSELLSNQSRYHRADTVPIYDYMYLKIHQTTTFQICRLAQVTETHCLKVLALPTV